MSIIDPRGFDNVIEWADFMAGALGFFSDPEEGADDNFERLDDPDEWQDWAMGVFGGSDDLGQDVPDPHAYDDWREWASVLFLTTNFTG